MTRTVLAWLVHFYTACGLLAAVLMGVLIVHGSDAAFRGAFALMIVASAIDATDGTLARRIDVKHVLPRFDGSLLDNLTDFHTYTTLPMFLAWRAAILPGALQWLWIVPILASAYGYSQTNAKTSDGFFLGFPSLWNVVVFYLYFLQLPLWTDIAVVTGLSVATFIPTRYLYPTRGGPFARLLEITGGVWIAVVVLVISRPLGERRGVTIVSLAYPIAYLGLSWWVETRERITAQAD
jgi:phosphatidylcholine synthase